MIEFLAPGIATAKEVMPEVSQLIEELEHNVRKGVLSWTSGQVSNDAGSSAENKTIRDTSVIGIGMPAWDSLDPAETELPINKLIYKMGKLFRDSFDPHIKEYTHHYGTEPREYDGYQLMKYGVGGKFNRHIDDHPDYPRRFSLLYYANDDYEGGEIGFDQFGILIKPAKHQLILFPSTYVYSHEVHPVTSGTRYSVVQWMR